MSEHVKLGDMIRFGITISHPASGYLVNADETPRFNMYRNNSDVSVLAGDFVARANLVGTYLGSGIISVANGFASADFVEVHASGRVGTIVGRAVVKDFVVDDVYDANVLQLSGVAVATSNYINDKVWNAVGNQYTANETFGSGLYKIMQNIYFAGIKFVKDSVVPDDEYTVQWFRNDKPTESGQVTNPAISVYKTDGTNTALFTNKILSYTHVYTGALRANEATTLAVSGEPYLAITSGIIDGQSRVWSNPIGLDYL